MAKQSTKEQEHPPKKMPPKKMPKEMPDDLGKKGGTKKSK